MTVWEIVFMLTGLVTGGVAMASWQLYRDSKRTAEMTAAIRELPDEPPEEWEHRLEYTTQIGTDGVMNLGEDGWQICGISGTAVFLKRRVSIDEDRP